MCFFEGYVGHKKSYPRIARFWWSKALSSASARRKFACSMTSFSKPRVALRNVVVARPSYFVLRLVKDAAKAGPDDPKRPTLWKGEVPFASSASARSTSWENISGDSPN